MARFVRQVCLGLAVAAAVGYGATSRGATIVPFDVGGGADVRAFLGVQLHTLDADMAAVLTLPGDVSGGAVVSQVYPRSPAEAAGLRPGDVIVAIDGEPIDAARDMARAVDRRRGGQRVALRVARSEAVEIMRARLALRHVGCDHTCKRATSTRVDTF